MAVERIRLKDLRMIADREQWVKNEAKALVEQKYDLCKYMYRYNDDELCEMWKYLRAERAKVYQEALKAVKNAICSRFFSIVRRSRKVKK